MSKYSKEDILRMVDDGLGDIEIPVLLLQTLVENSFSHGLTPERKGEISLFITKEKHNDAECLYICVSDNGKGFSAEVLEKIENNGEIYYNDRRHVGLQNIKKRLNLIYGEQAEFHLSNMDENFGAISEVWIPLQTKDTNQAKRFGSPINHLTDGAFVGQWDEMNPTQQDYVINRNNIARNMQNYALY